MNQAPAPIQKRKDIRTFLESPEVQNQLGMVATRHLPPDRLARLVLSAAAKTPKLLNCTPQSVLQAAMTCSQLGIEPDGRHAHLIPYGAECQLIIDYKGLIALARRNGVTGIVADVVCQHDAFEYYRDEVGTHFKHVPKFGERGAVIGAYCIAKLEGETDVEVMTRDEIEAIRRRSRGGGNGPWVTDWNEMAKKTVIRRHSKRWPISSDVADAFNDEIETEAPAATVRPGRAKALLPQSSVEAAFAADEAPQEDAPEEFPSRTVEEPPTAEEEVGQTRQSTIEEPPAPEQPKPESKVVRNVNAELIAKQIARAKLDMAKVMAAIHKRHPATAGCSTIEGLPDVTLMAVIRSWPEIAAEAK